MKERNIDNLHDSIEQWLSSAGKKIVQRGREYYRNGHITSLELLKNGCFDAEVEGSDDDYNVSVEVNPKTNKIVRCYCDCPYDYGDICKHIAAVLLAIREGDFQKKTVSSVNTKEPDFREVILTADETRLRQFVLECAGQDENFRSRLLAAFASLPEDRTLEEIKRKLDKAVSKLQRDTYRYDNSMEYDFQETVEEILSSLDDYSRNGYHLLVFKAAICVIQAINEVIGEIYECSSEIFDLQYDSRDRLRQSAERIDENGSEQEQKELCAFGLAEANDCGEYRETVLKAVIPCGIRWMPVQLDAAIERLFAGQSIDLDFYLEYIRTYKGETEYVNYLSSHLGIDRARFLMVRYDLEHGEFEKAEILCMERLKNEQYPYSRRQWREQLYEVYEAAGNTGKAAKTAKQLLLDGDGKYYDILKNLLVQTETWEEAYEPLMNELLQKLTDHLLFDILLKEKEYRILLDRIETTSGNAIFQYGPKIAEEFPEEVAMIYRAKIGELAEQASDRKSYQEICRHMKELAKFSGTESLRGMIADFRIRYKRRPAFMEELTKVERELGLDGTAGYT